MADWNRVTKPATAWTCWPEPSPSGSCSMVEASQLSSSRKEQAFGSCCGAHLQPCIVQTAPGARQGAGGGRRAKESTVWEPEGCPKPGFAQRAQLENPSRQARAEPAGCAPPPLPRPCGCGCGAEAAGAARARPAPWSGALDPGSAPSLALAGSIPGHARSARVPAETLPQHPQHPEQHLPLLPGHGDAACEQRDNGALALSGLSPPAGTPSCHFQDLLDAK